MTTKIDSEDMVDTESHDELIEKLTTGFGAMLEQVQELAKRNINLEQRLALVREQVRYFLLLCKPSLEAFVL